MKDKLRAKKAITNPPVGGYYFLIKNMWWIVDENENPVYYNGKAPQCNSFKQTIQDTMSSYMAKGYIPKTFQLKFFENIFEPVVQSEIKG